MHSPCQSWSAISEIAVVSGDKLLLCKELGVLAVSRPEAGRRMQLETAL